MNPLPAHLEADLLTLVEGGSLPADRAAAVADALAKDPALAGLVRAMQNDRADLASLPQVSAPADLLARVESVLERDALLGDPIAEPQGITHLPVSQIQPRGRTAWQVFRHSRWAAPVSMAAALAIIAGAILLVIGQRQSGPLSGAGLALNNPKPGVADKSGVPNSGTGVLEESAKSTDLTLADASTPPGSGTREPLGPGGGPATRSMDRGMRGGIAQNVLQGSFEDTAGDRDDRDTLLAAKPAPIAKEANPTASTAPAPAAGPAQPAPMIAAGAPVESAKDAAPAMSLDRAAELAVEGRLAFRVRSAAPERAQERLQAITNRFDWAGAPEAISPDEVAKLVARLNHGEGGRDEVRFAGLDANVPEANPAAERKDAAGAKSEAEAGPSETTKDRSLPPTVTTGTGSPTAPPAAVIVPPSPQAYVLTAPATSDRLGRLVHAIRSEPALGDVEFVELPRDPLVEAHQWLRRATPPALDPAQVVWWTLPVAQWSPRANLPVLVEPAKP